MNTTFQDAERYVILAEAGWADPSVNQLELIKELISEHQADVAYEVDAARQELEEEHAEALEAAKEELKDEQSSYLHDEEWLAQAGYDTLLEALKIAVEDKMRKERDDLAKANETYRFRIRELEAIVAAKPKRGRPPKVRPPEATP